MHVPIIDLITQYENMKKEIDKAVLSLPTYPELTDEQVTYVVKQAVSFFNG